MEGLSEKFTFESDDKNNQEVAEQKVLGMMKNITGRRKSACEISEEQEKTLKK